MRGGNQEKATSKLFPVFQQPRRRVTQHEKRYKLVSIKNMQRISSWPGDDVRIENLCFVSINKTVLFMFIYTLQMCSMSWRSIF